MATVQIALLAETRRATAGINQVNSKLGSIGKVAKTAGLALGAAFIGGAAIRGLKSIVQSASDAQQSLGATETVFGKFSKNVIADSNAAAKSVGLSGNAYRENANLIGSLFKNQGVASDQLAGKTKNMIKTASDLAATFGGTTTSAVEALGSAFKGEFDPLEKYGISIKQSSINAELAAKGQDKLTGAALKAAQQQATTRLIMKQSKDSLGAFGRESDTLAHQQQVLGAQFENVKAAIGTRLLPVLTKFLTFLTTKGPEAIESFKEMAKPVTAFFDKFKSGSSGASGNLNNFLATAKSVWASVQSTISSAVTIIQSLWNLFGSTILANVQSTFTNLLTIIRGAFQVIKGVFDVFAGILTGDWKRVWTGLKSIASGLFNILKGLTKQLWNTIVTVFKIGGITIKALFRGAWNALKGIAVAAWSGVKSATTSGISKVVSAVKGLPGKIKSGLGNVKNMLYDAGVAIISGLMRGILDKAEDLYNKVKGIGKKIKDLKGPLSYDKVMLTPEGEAIISGLIKGIDNKTPDLYKTVRGVTKTLASTSFATGGLDFGVRGLRAQAVHHHVTIKVDVPVGADPVTTGREVEKALNAYYDATGGKRR